MSDNKTTLSRVERKRLARIDGILDTAMTVVAKEGIDGFSLHKLAAELDLTVGAFYRYFPSKMALIGALETKVIKAFGREFRETIDRFESHFTTRKLQSASPELWSYVRCTVLIAGGTPSA